MVNLTELQKIQLNVINACAKLITTSVTTIELTTSQDDVDESIARISNQLDDIAIYVDKFKHNSNVNPIMLTALTPFL